MISLSVPHLAGKEWEYVKDCLDTGWISSAGSYVDRFERMVADFAGAKYGIACMNGTAGLHIAQLMAGVKPGDHVIVPNITFVATLNALTYTGAEAILVDVDAGNWQMDLGLLEEFLENNTYLAEPYHKGEDAFYHLQQTGHPIKAIMPVHVLGNVGDMEKLLAIAKKYRLEVVEDSTESLGSFYKEKHTGTFGKIGVFSFNGNKIISTGGGGVIITDDEVLAKKAKHLTTQAKASSEEYFHDEIGFNYRLVNVLAAIGVAQMEQLPSLLVNKGRMDTFYRDELSNVGDIEFQQVLEGVNPNCWLFTFKTARMRELLHNLNKNGVQSRPFWCPMNRLPMFASNIYVTKNDVSAGIYESCISIPSSAGITQGEMEEVVKQIKHFYNG